jgi:predicted GNAT superfamily acetyltransferase
MNYPDSNFRLDFSKINWHDYQADGINLREVMSVYNDAEKEWYPIADPQTGERYYFIIGFGSKARYVFVLLKEHRTDFNALIVDRILVATHEPQIRKYYYEPKFKAR